MKSLIIASTILLTATAFADTSNVGLIDLNKQKLGAAMSYNQFRLEQAAEARDKACSIPNNPDCSQAKDDLEALKVEVARDNAQAQEAIKDLNVVRDNITAEGAPSDTLNNRQIAGATDMCNYAVYYIDPATGQKRVSRGQCQERALKDAVKIIAPNGASGVASWPAK